MISANARIYVGTKTVDFRGSFDALAGVVRERFGQNPRSGAFFVFFNRSFDRVKVLFFDQTGDCIFYKRLDESTFRGIVDLDPSKERVEIEAKQLRDLLAGLPKPRRGKKNIH